MRLIIPGITAGLILAIAVLYRQGQPATPPAEATASPAAHEVLPTKLEPKTSNVRSPATPAAQTPTDGSGEFPLNHERPANNLDPITFENSDYAFYDTSVLAEMANGGDVTAMQVLAMRFFTAEPSDENLRNAKELMREAAAHGARYYPFKTLAESAGFELELALLDRLELPEERLRETLIETLSYGQLAAMRGNQDLEMALNHKFMQNHGLEVSADEWTEVRRRAGMKYAELEARRQELGLGPFGDQPDAPAEESHIF